MTATPHWLTNLKGRGRRGRLGLGILALTFSSIPGVQAQVSGRTDVSPPAEPHLRSEHHCPTDLSALIPPLIRDLPTYANLVASRSQEALIEQPIPPGSVLLAGNPEFEAINLAERSPRPQPILDETVQQVFFTTLERQYLDLQAVMLQHYHWLFLVPDETGWRLVLLYSSVGSYPDDGSPPSPARESSHGVIGQAIQLWLRDCRAGAIVPSSPGATRGDEPPGFAFPPAPSAFPLDGTEP